MITVERIREWLFDKCYDGIIIHRRDNFAWINGGAESAVLSSGETGVAYFIINKVGMDIIADSSDLPRMKVELNPLGANPILVPWYQSMEEFLSDYVKGGRYASDDGVAGTTNVQAEMIDLRLCLTVDEVRHYEEIGQTCANIVEGVCKEAQRGDSEIEIANSVKTGCIAHGISPDCVLVGADRRILDYRHPVPTDKKIEKSLMVVLGGQKYGLNISMTRMVYFGAIPSEIEERYKKTSHIFACMQHIMKEGLSIIVNILDRYVVYIKNVATKRSGGCIIKGDLPGMAAENLL